MTEIPGAAPEHPNGGDTSAQEYRQLAELADQGANSAEHERPSRLIVEVGAGRQHSFAQWKSVADRRHFGHNEQYLGIDIGAIGGSGIDAQSGREEKDSQMRQRWAALQTERPDEQIRFAQADGRHLPLPDESADEVLFANVFGYGANPDQWSDLFGEANRVLKPAGKIVIEDDQSPYHKSHSRMNTVVEGAGLVPDEQRMRLVLQAVQPDDYASLIAEHGFESNPLFQNNVVWEISKLEPQPATQPQEQPQPTRRRPFWRRGKDSH